MKTFYVIYEEPCDNCGGAGYHDNPNWSDYFAETGGYSDLSSKEWGPATMKWFRARGFTTMPPEEIICAYCDGEGICTGRVTLVEALAEMQEEQ